MRNNWFSIFVSNNAAPIGSPSRATDTWTCIYDCKATPAAVSMRVVEIKNSYPRIQVFQGKTRGRLILDMQPGSPDNPLTIYIHNNLTMPETFDLLLSRAGNIGSSVSFIRSHEAAQSEAASLAAEYTTLDGHKPGIVDTSTWE